MGCYKEADHLFNDYYVKQEQIYNDACDSGIPVKSFADQLCIELAAIFADTGKWKGFIGGIKKHREVGYHRDGKTVQYSTVTVYLPWEQDGKYYRCTRWDITYNNDPARKKQYISFTPYAIMADETKIWEDA